MLQLPPARLAGKHSDVRMSAMSDRGIHESVSQWLLALEGPHWVAIAVAAAALIVGVHSLRRWLEGRRARAILDEALRLELITPASLHPVIDPDICIGSGSCLSACPEGKILGLVDGVATLIDASHCIGHGKCAAECPVSAIRLVFGSAERGVELPEVDEFFETSRPGVHIVGELGGMGLIKNALTQGLQVAARLGQTLSRPPGRRGPGSGDRRRRAGRDRDRGRRARRRPVVRSSSSRTRVGGTVAHYPRQKLVMTETREPALLRRVRHAPGCRRRSWSRRSPTSRRRRDIQVHEQTKVTGHRRRAGRLRRHHPARGRARAPRGPGDRTARHARGCWACPARSCPRSPTGWSTRTSTRGSGCWWWAAATRRWRRRSSCGARATGEVTIAYRRPEFGALPAAEQAKARGALAAGRVRALMSTEIAEVEADAVVVDAGACGHRRGSRTTS